MTDLCRRSWLWFHPGIERVIRGEQRWTVEHTDCLVALRAMGDASVDVCITDPPYSAHTHSKQWIGAALTSDGKPRVSTAHKGLGFEHMTEDLAGRVLAELARTVRRWILVFSDLEGAEMWRRCGAVTGLDYVRTCIWDKVDSAPQFTGDRPAAAAEAIVCFHRPGKKRWNGGGRRNVFRYEVNGERGAKPHPSTKPLPLMVELVELFSDADETVLDLFCGSGSTGAAALRRGRRFIGCDVQEQWSRVSAERLVAESSGVSLAQSRTGNLPLFGSGGAA